MSDIAPRSAARRLASELKLPAYRGVVLCQFEGSETVLVVAADGLWRRKVAIPQRYCGYRVREDDPLIAVAHT